MQRACDKFLSLMDVEFMDLDGHIEALISKTLDRYHRDEISEHVCLSNLAVLRKEKHAIAHFRGILARLRSETFADVQELTHTVRKSLREQAQRFDLSEAACHFALHKIEHVEDYISRTHWAEEKREYLDSVDVE